MIDKEPTASQSEESSSPSTPMHVVLSGLAQHIESLLDRLESDSQAAQVREIEGLLERMAATEDYLKGWIEHEGDSDLPTQA